MEPVAEIVIVADDDEEVSVPEEAEEGSSAEPSGISADTEVKVSTGEVIDSESRFSFALDGSTNLPA